MHTYYKVIAKVFLLLASIYILNYNGVWAHINRFIYRPGDFSLTIMSAVAFIGIWLLFIICILLFSFSGWKVRLISFIIFLINSLFYIVYNNISSTEMSYFEFISLITSISSYTAGFIWTFTTTIIYVLLWHIPFAVCFFLFPSIKTKPRYIVLAFILYMLTVFLITGILFYKKTGYGSQKMPSFIVPTAFLFTYSLENISSNDNFSLGANRKISTVNTQGVKNIILVIDESIRYDFIDLNVNQGTTPALLANSVNIINFGKSVSYANCSQYTNGLVRHMARYGKETDDLHHEQFIWDIAKNAGYKSYLLDGQLDGNGHNFFTKKELQDVTVIPAAHFAGDIDTSKRLVELLNTKPEEKKFILLINKGAHFPYINTGFPKIFEPALKTTDIRDADHTELTNSYKNLVHYNTNGFFDYYFHNYRITSDTVMIYTSDHGQNLSDLNIRMTHCSTIDPKDTEGEVPLLIIGNKKVTDNKLLEFLKTMNRMPSHYDIPPLLMSYMGYSEKAIDSYTDYRSFNSVGFVYGNVGGYFGGKPERQVIKKD